MDYRRHILRFGVSLLSAGACLSCTDDREALVHLSFPEDMKFASKKRLFDLVGEGSVSLNLPKGVQILEFEKKGKRYAAVIDVATGGEIYWSLHKEDIVPVVKMWESGYPEPKDTPGKPK